MKKSRVLTIAGLCAALVACVDSPEFTIDVGIDGQSGYLMPTDFQSGDTIVLKAAERIESYAQGNNTRPEEPVPPFSTAPDQYVWSVSDTTIARLASPGKLVMREPGVTTLTVSTVHTKNFFIISVVPRISSLRIEPHDVTLNVGDSVQLTVDGLGADGQPLTIIRGRPGAMSMVAFDQASNPVLAITRTVIPSTWSFRALRSGEVSIVGRSNVYRAEQLRDTARVTVR